MATPKLNFISRDFASVRESLTELVKQRFPLDWVEFNQTGIATAILDVVAWAHGQRAFYSDMQAQNSFLDTAFLPEAILSIATKQLGYKRRGATSAAVAVTVFPTPPQPVQIVIPKGTKLSIDDLIFETPVSYTIPSGKAVYPDNITTEKIIFTEGESKQETKIADGIAYQKIVLAHKQVIMDSLQLTIDGEIWAVVSSLFITEGTGQGRDVFVGTGTDAQKYKLSLLFAILDLNNENKIIVLIQGEKWEQVEEFSNAPQEYKAAQDNNGVTTILFGRLIDGAAPQINQQIDILYQISGPQKRYTVEENENNEITIRFGDGISGIIPTNGTEILFNYRIGGGIKGNLPRAKINTTIAGVLPSSAETTLRIFNQEQGSGGEDAESYSRIKLFAPLFSKSNERAVRTLDFSILAATYKDVLYGAPSFASAKLKQETPEKNEVEIAVWSRDNKGRIATASKALQIAIKTFLDSKRTTCTYIVIVDGKVIYFDIVAKVKIIQNSTITTINDSANALLLNYFNALIPGAVVAPNEITAILKQEIPEILQIDLESIKGSVLQTIDFGIGNNVITEFSGYFPLKSGLPLVPGSFEISDGNQKIIDNGQETLTGDLNPTLSNKIVYETGKFICNFTVAPNAVSFIQAESRRYEEFAAPSNEPTLLISNKIDGRTQFYPIVKRKPIGISDGQVISVILPKIHTPYRSHRIVFFGGFDNFATQAGGQLMAFDDGEGNIVGDVLPGGKVVYDTGVVNFVWNTIPPPSGYTTYYGRLLQVPDGIRKEFSFEIRTASGGGGTRIQLLTFGGVGRTKFILSDLSSLSLPIKDAWDNYDGKINGDSLDASEISVIEYANSFLGYSLGKVFFQQALPNTVGLDFVIQIAPVTVFLYSAFSAFVTEPNGYKKIVIADHKGRLYRDIANAYPFSELDHDCGHFQFDLAPVPNAIGETLELAYDSLVQSNVKGLPIDKLSMVAFSSVAIGQLE